MKGKEKKRVCKNCGKELENGRQFCPTCGKEQPTGSFKPNLLKGLIVGGIVIFCFVAFWWVTRTNNYNVNNGEESYTESDGTRITKSESGIRTQVKRIPYKEICYNDEEFSITSIELYQDKSLSGHGYYPYVVVKFDFSSLSEDGLYWLMKDYTNSVSNTFTVDAYLTSNKNNYDFKAMSKINAVYNKENAVIVFGIIGESKYDFGDAYLTVTVDVKQDDTYDYVNKETKKTSQLNKVNEYVWRLNGEYDSLKIPILDSSKMEEKIKNIIEEGYEKLNKYYKNLN